MAADKKRIRDAVASASIPDDGPTARIFTGIRPRHHEEILADVRRRGWRRARGYIFSFCAGFAAALVLARMFA